MTRAIPVLAATLTLAVGVVASASSAQAVKPKTYKNCTQLNKVYPHGVAKPGARDRTSGVPVTGFTVDKKTYNLNTKSDRDKDGIACEKK
jgi:hypothetical protein